MSQRVFKDNLCFCCGVPVSDETRWSNQGVCVCEEHFGLKAFDCGEKCPLLLEGRCFNENEHPIQRIIRLKEYLKEVKS